MVTFDNTPFCVSEHRIMDCQFGKKYYKNRQTKGKRQFLQGTRKVGCFAHIECKTYTTFPEYKIKEDVSSMSSWKLRGLKEDKMRQLTMALKEGK